ncbi:hypothetical protein [Sphingomonas sp.]|uniref:hypothetical protein n=1 Tax=Sphingomonas sp. TaxID=28214 RepID=UPI0035C7F5A4
MLEPNSNAGFDARDSATRQRYEVKARRLTSPNQSAQLSALRGLPEQRFDLIAVLLFAADFSVATAALIPHVLVLQRGSYVAHTNSWRLVVTPAQLAHTSIEDVTTAVRAISGGDDFTT